MTINKWGFIFFLAGTALLLGSCMAPLADEASTPATSDKILARYSMALPDGWNTPSWIADCPDSETWLFTRHGNLAWTKVLGSWTDSFWTDGIKNVNKTYGIYDPATRSLRIGIGSGSVIGRLYCLQTFDNLGHFASISDYQDNGDVLKDIYSCSAAGQPVSINKYTNSVLDGTQTFIHDAHGNCTSQTYVNISGKPGPSDQVFALDPAKSDPEQETIVFSDGTECSTARNGRYQVLTIPDQNTVCTSIFDEKGRTIRVETVLTSTGSEGTTSSTIFETDYDDINKSESRYQIIGGQRVLVSERVYD